MGKDQKMKVGLVSFHAEYNFGTMLQAYALWHAISNLGYDSEYISFSQGESKSLTMKVKSALILLFTDWRKFYKHLTYKSPFRFWRDPEFASAKKEFDDFYNKYIPNTLKIYKPVDFITEMPIYSNYIVGSDQTWSPYRYSDKNPFFLSYVNNTKLKNAYAPSIGTSIIPDNLKPIYQRELKSFNHLSCREKAGCNLLEKLIGKKVEYVLDPTLLLKTEQWDKLIAPPIIKHKYILCYLLGMKNCILDFAEKLGNESNLPVYYIVTSPFYLKQQNKLLGIGPTQFISLIKGAEYVCTDSYHGTLFAINYRKNYYSFMKREGVLDTIDNSRIIDVLKELSLLNRFKKDRDFSFEPNIDYTLLDNSIDRLRKSSIGYLKIILENK